MLDILSIICATTFLLCSSSSVVGFAYSGKRRSNSAFDRQRGWMSTNIFSVAIDKTTTATTSKPPTWEDLSLVLDDLKKDDKESSSAVVTLYRDTNGWCPFCERVWVALRAKGIPYRESLINLRDKPDWYKDLVPTTLVPAILLHNKEDEKERRIIWESLDILQALDEAFPDTPRLMHDTAEFKSAMEMNDELVRAGFSYLYGGRNETLSEEELTSRLNEFQTHLDNLDESLSSGPFRLGKDFSGMDAIMIPTLERWRYQLPITHGIRILENRPSLERWFQAMESYPPYINRVAGDEYSWTAVASSFLRFFADSDQPDVKQKIERADSAASELTKSFSILDEEYPTSAAIEAATKLISNYEAIVADCTRNEPLSQNHIQRSNNETAADVVLRHVASLLLKKDVMEAAKMNPLLLENQADEAALAARTVAARLCVPRDMSKPAASVLRAVLATIADQLCEEK